jgi:hypothetical protein
MCRRVRCRKMMIIKSASEESTLAKCRTGAADFVQRARAYVACIHELGASNEACPSIATRKQKFSPVLVEELLRAKPDIYSRMLDIHPVLRTAARLREVLDEIERGVVENSSSLRYAMNRRNLRGPGTPFDLMYGALQLLATSLGTSEEDRYTELFILVTSMIYGLESRKRDGGIHVEHFLAHAAVFIASATADDWTTVRRKASVLIERWGSVQPPAAVLVHCAHNLRINCRGLAESDLQYDLVKHLRARVKNREIAATSAFEVLTLTFG